MTFTLPRSSVAPGGSRPLPTGNHATCKVRRIARKRGEDLGELRHVESARNGKWLLLSIGLFWILMSTIMMLGAAPSLIMVAIFAAIIGIVHWSIAHQKLLVFDRGIVIGSFIPGSRPMTLLFETIDAATVRVSYNYPSRAQVKLHNDYNGFAMDHARHECLWLLYSITFLGPSGEAVRGSTNWKRAKRIRPLVAGEAPADTVWSFGASTLPRLERTLHAMVDAMIDAGVPGADKVVEQAWPPRKITGTLEDAEYLCIPERQRAFHLLSERGRG